MAQGHTAAGFAAQIGVSCATLTNWARQHPEFAAALAAGRAGTIAFWERELARIAESGKGNASAAIFALKNCAAENEAETALAAVNAPPEYSDLELARRIAHILMLAEHPERQADDIAIP
jgi:hypothetical protein